MINDLFFFYLENVEIRVMLTRRESNQKLIFSCVRSKNSFFVIHFLKRFKIDNVVDENGDTILLNILKHGTVEMLKFYVSKFGYNDFNGRDCQGVNYMFFLMERRDLDIETVRSCMLHCDVDLNQRSTMYGSLLYHAILHRQIQIIRLLLILGADANSCDARGNPVIFYCVLHGLLEISSILVSTYEFDVNITNASGQSILEVSIIKNMFIHSKLLMKKHPDDLRNTHRILEFVEMCIERGNTVLAWKLYQNYAACIIQQKFRSSPSPSRLRTWMTPRIADSMNATLPSGYAYQP